MSERSNGVEKSLLAIGYVWPEPNSSAAGKHMLSLLAHFAQMGYTIIFASPAQLGDHKVDLTQLGYTEVNIKLTCGSFDEFVTTLDPQIVLFDRYMMEDQFGGRVSKCWPNELQIHDTENWKVWREASHKPNKSWNLIDTRPTKE